MSETVKIKPLEWETWPEDGSQLSEGQNQKREYVERALTPWGSAIFLMVKDGVYSLMGAGELDYRSYAFSGTAKADVQSYFETCIRSALQSGGQENG